MAAILVFFHCESNPGFAASRHELSFLEMARRLVGSYDKIHFAYRTLKDGRSLSLPKELGNVIEFDASSRSEDHLSYMESYIRRHDIRVAFGFDQPVRRLSHKYLRRGGVRCIVSYLGAPMSSLNRGPKLALKRLDVALARHRPDHYIFQSEGMRQTAVKGRGIPLRCTSLVRTGIDLERFSPPPERDWYAHDQFGISRDRKIIFFSGHMEARKGVHVILNTAKFLVDRLGRSDVHFLILGNRAGQEKRFESLYRGTRAESHITFGGYRDDVPLILRSCKLGMIPSVEWDSFPMSSIEMAATGLPLIVSDLPGLRETVTPRTGFLLPPGDYQRAARHIIELLDNEILYQGMGKSARQRAVSEFSTEKQVDGMEAVVRKVAGDILPPEVPPAKKHIGN